jgi:hypothetical protein
MRAICPRLFQNSCSGALHKRRENPGGRRGEGEVLGVHSPGPQKRVSGNMEPVMTGVRRQSFWDKDRLKIRESLAPLVYNIMRLADGAASGDWRLSVV